MAFDFETILIPSITGLASGIVSAVLTYFGTRSKIRLDLSAEYDKELRASRLEVYKELWKLLKPLARYSRESPLTYSVVKKTSEDMRDWYFDRGGIYLSRASRDPYFEMKKAMQVIIDDTTLAERSDEPLSGREIAVVLKKGTALRKSLADKGCFVEEKS